ncbi:hypothetical protein K439DRAFT_1636903 [Ramaria rubella]|nr:hypothetical protein K439DRAFT_1636903 [Ramaria rubella]
MGGLTITRSVLLIALVVSSAIVLGMSANFLNLSLSRGHDGDHDDDSDSDDGDDHDRLHETFGFESTAVVIAALTLLTVLPVLVMNFVRRRCVTSVVLFEIGWVSILMILWVVSAGQTSGTSMFIDRCSDSDADDDIQAMCDQFRAIQAFSWINFIMLLLWLAVVMVVALMAHNRGHTRVWTYPFSDAAILCRPPSSLGVVEPKNGIYTPEQQPQSTTRQMLPQEGEGGPTHSGFPPQVESVHGQVQQSPPHQSGPTAPQQGISVPPPPRDVSMLPQV